MYELGDLKLLENEMFVLASDTTAVATEENDMENEESESDDENEQMEQSAGKNSVGNMSKLFGPSVDTVWKKRTKQQRKKQSKLIKKIPAAIKLFEEAQNNYIRGDFNVALELLDAAIRIDSNKFDLYNIRAIIYEELNELKLALNSYLIVARMCPDNIEVIKKIAYLAFNLEDYYNSKVAINRILSVESTYYGFETLNMHCMCELNLGHVAEAERLYSIFVAKFPEEISFVVEFALSLETFGYKKKALKYYLSYVTYCIGNFDVKDSKLQQFLNSNILIVNAPDASNEDERFSDLFFAASKIIEYFLSCRTDESNILALDILDRLFEYKTNNATNAVSTPTDIQVIYAVTLIRSIDTTNKEKGLTIIQKMLNLFTESTRLTETANLILSNREPEIADFDQLIFLILHDNNAKLYTMKKVSDSSSELISVLKCQLLAVDELIILKRTTLGERILNNIVNKLETMSKCDAEKNGIEQLSSIADLWYYSSHLFQNIEKYSKAIFCALKAINFDICNVIYVSNLLVLLDACNIEYSVNRGDILRAHFSQLVMGAKSDKVNKGFGLKLAPSIFKYEVKYFFEMLNSIQTLNDSYMYYTFAMTLCHSLTIKTKCQVLVYEDEELAVDYIKSSGIQISNFEYSGLLQLLCFLNHYVNIIVVERDNIMQIVQYLCEDKFHSIFLARKDDIELVDKVMQMLTLSDSLTNILHNIYPHLIMMKVVEPEIVVATEAYVGDARQDKSETNRLRKSTGNPLSSSDQSNLIEVASNNQDKRRRSRGALPQQVASVTIQSMNQLIRQSTQKSIDGVNLSKDIGSNNKFIKSLVEAHEQAHNRRYGESLDLYLEAFILQPDQPLISLCLASYLTFMSNHPLVRRRHETLLKAISCLSFYAKTRVVRVKNNSGNKVTTSALLQEVYYNIARVFHEIRLHHIAVNYYKLALKLADENESIRFLNVTFDAAHNLVLILRKSGSTGEAFNIMKKYLKI